MKSGLRPIAAAAALAAMLVPAAAAPIDKLIVGVPRVVDGDTLHLGGRYVRFWAIDAPEAGERYGDQATRFLAEMIAAQGGAVACLARGRDRYDRDVAECKTVSGASIAVHLIANGWAQAMPRYGDASTTFTSYRFLEREARCARLGMWQQSPRPDDCPD